MATVTGLTAARMITMENATVVDGDVVVNDLILKTRDGTTINAGNVRGPIGPSGAAFIICTSTTRPALSAGEEGKAIYETDTDLVRVWTGARWRCQERIVCTSTTRPAMVAADEGVKIYETDSDMEFIWTGSAWLLAPRYESFADAAQRTSRLATPPEGSMSYLRDVDALEVYAGSAWRKPWNMPWGQLGYAEITFADVVNTETPISGSSITVNVVGNRRVRLSALLQGQSDTQPIFWTVYIKEGPVYIQMHTISTPAPAQPATCTPMRVITPFAGSHTYSLSAITGSPEGHVNTGAMPGCFLVEDIGPAGAMT